MPASRDDTVMGALAVAGAAVLAGAIYLLPLSEATSHSLVDGYGMWIALSALIVAGAIGLIVFLLMKMRHVSAALDKEVWNLSEAAALADKSGEDVVLAFFRSSEPTFRQVLGVSAAVLLRLNRERATLTPVAAYGVAHEDGAHPANIKLTGRLATLLTSREPISVEDVADHPIGTLAPRARLGELHGQLLPLVANGQTMGYLCLLKPREEPFRAEDLDLLRAVSGELGITWYNALIYERLSDETSRLGPRVSYESEERRIEALKALTDAVLSERSLMGSVMDSIADGVILTDVVGTIRLLNPKACAILRQRTEDAIGRNAVDFVQQFEPVSVEVMKAQFRKIVEQGVTVTTEIQLSLPTTRFYELSLAPVRSPDGLVHGIVAVLSDITHLKELDRMKTDLMSMVTHEIRTPLATVRGFAQILLKGGAGPAKTSEFLEIIHRQSNRLVNLVNDFLDITRIESGRQKVSRGPVNLDKLVRNVLADLKPLADEKDILLRYAAPAVVPEIYADRNLIEQVLINLLSNAVKYSARGAWAEVVLRPRDEMWAVSVRDNGLGIPEQALPRLFEKFYRVRCDDRKDIIGTGLGLSLVKQIIDVHGGGIEVESKHGEGSDFRFTIPAFQDDRPTLPSPSEGEASILVH